MMSVCWKFIYIPLRYNWALCHAMKQRSYWCIYDFLLDIMFFNFVPSLCVHVSVWTYIFMIGVYLETFTHESSYIFNWYSNSLVTTFYCFWFVGGFYKAQALFFSWYFFAYLNKLVDLFALFFGLCSILSRREWGFHVVHTILKCRVPLCACTLGSSLFILDPFLDPFYWLVTSFVEVSFNLFSFAIFGSWI